MSSTTFSYRNSIEGYFKKYTYNIFNLKQQRYFLLCNNCFWMATTIPTFSSIQKIKYKKCPLCANDTDRFLICHESF